EDWYSVSDGLKAELHVLAPYKLPIVIDVLSRENHSKGLNVFPYCLKGRWLWEAHIDCHQGSQTQTESEYCPASTHFIQCRHCHCAQRNVSSEYRDNSCGQPDLLRRARPSRQNCWGNFCEIIFCHPRRV